MSRNIVVVSNRLDVYPAQSLARELGDCRTLVFDPELLDVAPAAGLHGAELFPWQLGTGLGEIYRQAHALALQLDALVEPELARLVPNSRQCYWHFHGSFYFAKLVCWYGALWDHFIANCPGASLHVIVCDSPARFGYQSFVPAMLLLERLKLAQRPFNAYSYRPPELGPDLIPMARPAADAAPYELFSHLPTCFYDHPYFVAEILASGRSCLNFPTQYWNAPIAGLDSAALCPVDEALERTLVTERGEIEAGLARIADLLTGEIGRWLSTPDFARRQALRFADGYRSLIAAYSALEADFAQRPPRRILLSDHDAGIHGAFVSFARAHAIPLSFLPHSKILYTPIPCPSMPMDCLTHPIQGFTMADIAGHRLRPGPLAFPETLTLAPLDSPALKTLGIIINGVSLSGICHLVLRDFSAGLRRILAWAARNGVSCRLRCKPTNPLINWLAGELSLQRETLVAELAGSLLDFARGCDVCLTYDVPTTGVIHLLGNAIPVLNPLDRALIDEEMLNVNPAIIPRAPVDETLVRLDSFLADPSNLVLFRRQQFAAYVAAQATALPLRCYLQT